ncbi:Uncharacterized protein APZ42_017366 [Daphnia magna]|uniref:Uncharacterized protein n=1 Tax=Daphnia magna TaxID=35525 RepID=A0A0P5SST0_9CRUS|nr:Uncharacterized protein APZ42_017366 [Daphnia magna]
MSPPLGLTGHAQMKIERSIYRTTSVIFIKPCVFWLDPRHLRNSTKNISYICCECCAKKKSSFCKD